MNYLALLSVCAACAPDFFYVYNLSDWFQEERSLKLKSRMWLEPRASPPIWMSTLVRNRLLADGQTLTGFPAPIQSFPFFNLVIFQPPESCIFWAPNQWDMFHFRYECKF